MSEVVPGSNWRTLRKRLQSAPKHPNPHPGAHWKGHPKSNAPTLDHRGKVQTDAVKPRKKEPGTGGKKPGKEYGKRKRSSGVNGHEGVELSKGKGRSQVSGQESIEAEKEFEKRPAGGPRADENEPSVPKDNGLRVMAASDLARGELSASAVPGRTSPRRSRGGPPAGRMPKAPATPKESPGNISDFTTSAGDANVPPKSPAEEQSPPKSNGIVEAVPGSPSTASSGEEDEDPSLVEETTKFVAMDCEMVGVGPNGRESALARVSIVDYNGVVLLDEFVKPLEPVTDYRTWVSGIRPHDLSNGVALRDVQEAVSSIMEEKVLIGHALHHDLRALFLSHPRKSTRDTAEFFRQGSGRTPGLKRLSEYYLGWDIQGAEHSSVQDAQACMLLFRKFESDWIKAGSRLNGRGHTKRQVNRSPSARKRVLH